MRRLPTLLSALSISLALVGAGCRSGSTDSTITGTEGTASEPVGSVTPGIAGGPLSGKITVSAAASLTSPFKTIGDDFENANPGVDLTFNFDSSSTLAQQIQDGAPADVFASADAANMKKLTDANQTAGTPRVFARNQLTIVVKKGNPRNIKTLADLTTAGTISLCGSDVPCGKYADQILKTANVTIPADKITRGQNVKATLTAVSEGDAEAGIVYVTDVTGGDASAVAIPDAQNVIATYPIAVLKESANSATAQAFIASVLSPAGQATLKVSGFLPPT